MKTKDIERFKSKYRESCGCWIWKGSSFLNGYGQFYCDKKNKKAHRIAWEIVNGPIPEGMLICHKCDVRSCVNPAHLYVGTQKENIKDCIERRRQRYAKRDSCERGHLYDENNTYMYGNIRVCRTCNRDNARERYRRMNPGAPRRKPYGRKGNK